MGLRTLVGVVLLAPALLWTGAAEADGSTPGLHVLFPGHPYAHLNCGTTEPGKVHCMASALTNPDGTVRKFANPQGYGPSDLQSAYGLPTSGGGGKIVALVDAYDYPTAEADLAAYRSQYGLSACTSASGCFQKVGQDGSTTNLPGGDGQGCNGWNGEESLDIDMVSAACPDCKILLVEANSTSDQDLAAALQTAVSMGASAISNSYGGPEDSSVTEMESYYTQYANGILVTAAAGDSGYGASYPATSAGVVAVGGTTLAQDSSSRGWGETVWGSNGATGSGCSAFIPKPSWQTDPSCGQRMEADISAVADPQTGVNTYCAGQFEVVGGTSAATPIVAAAFVLLGVSPNPQYIWTHTSDFYDVTSGSNGSCSPSYYCNAGVGYDGPTGWGTPNGPALKAMTSSSSGGSGGSSGSSSGATGSGSGGSSSGGSSSGSSGASSSGGSGSSGSGGGSGAGSSSGSGGDTGSSGASGGSSSGGVSSSGGSGGSEAPPANLGSSDAGAQAGNNTNPPSSADLADNLNTPAGCGCTAVGAPESARGYGAGGLAIGFGLVFGWAARRRRSGRRAR